MGSYINANIYWTVTVHATCRSAGARLCYTLRGQMQMSVYIVRDIYTMSYYIFIDSQMQGDSNAIHHTVRTRIPQLCTIPYSRKFPWEKISRISQIDCHSQKYSLRTLCVSIYVALCLYIEGKVTYAKVFPQKFQFWDFHGNFPLYDSIHLARGTHRTGANAQSQYNA